MTTHESFATATFPVDIRPLTGDETNAALPDLIGLLRDAVDNGASVGFMAPLAESTARQYWLDVFASLSRGEREIWVAQAGDRLVGAVQLEPCGKANGRHRAEVQKLFVHSHWRRKGLARRLMQALEQWALEHGRSLLVLDTETGSAAEQLYQSLGFALSGQIPDFALSPDGTLRPTSVYYRQLSR
ncbi:GNAT family N-acetyltransferase [Parachitinimonas caeni]|uniref:GNAT family N-acetyltransferase n=1 Tax=Parachitinimonas caeni TaxID=3031301 RepID=A0ABT7DWB0_9NEIS|nr:GNAT family N-acetyltransferase [Parachitinimonas caeni]MDK2124351.1 GNAT family N-acetyltransferase [Parachitinimonas caeni]